MVVTPSGMIIEVRLLQYQKAVGSMVLTLLGIFTVVKLEHPVKSPRLMVSNFSESVTVVRPLQ
jgi:hypothetical protein